MIDKSRKRRFTWHVDDVVFNKKKSKSAIIRMVVKSYRGNDHA